MTHQHLSHSERLSQHTSGPGLYTSHTWLTRPVCAQKHILPKSTNTIRPYARLSKQKLNLPSVRSQLGGLHEGGTSHETGVHASLGHVQERVEQRNAISRMALNNQIATLNKDKQCRAHLDDTHLNGKETRVQYHKRPAANMTCLRANAPLAIVHAHNQRRWCIN